MSRASEPLEIVHTLLSYPILEGAHALDHLPLGFQTAVYVIGGQEVFGH